MNRSDYIGSSDARAILSGDWDTLYREKKGFIASPDLSDSFPVQLGALIEPFHIDWSIRRLNEERGLPTYEWSKGPEAGAQHWSLAVADGPNRAVLGSHPDALIRLIGTSTAYPLEVKHTGRWTSADEAADYYMPQLQHHMFCWGTDRLLFSVIIGNAEPERLWVGASQDYQRHYLARCDAFWRHVVENDPPAPAFFNEGSPEVKVPQAIKDSVPINGFKRRDISTDNRAQALVPEFLETKRAAKRHDEIKDELKAMMAPDEGELYSSVISLKRDKRGAIRISVKDETA